MTAQIAATHPQLPPDQAGRLLRDFVEAFDSIQKQLSDGTVRPAVSLSKISSLGVEGIGILKKHLEDSTSAAFSITVNASANSISLMPTGLMPPKQKLTKQSLANAGEVTTGKGAVDKVPRPPNAFIIYRKEWHSKVVAQNPGLHNNAISVIIGDKWRAESEEVRAIYKRKAEEAKRQHELDHPDYQYQPRKPSEKKRRMTKNKLAKMAKARTDADAYNAVQQSLPQEFDPAALLDDILGAHTTSHPMQVTSFATDHTTHPLVRLNTQQGPVLAFETGPDVEDRLFAGLQQFNAQVNAQTQPALHNDALLAQPIVNGQPARLVKSFPITPSPQTQSFIQDTWHHGGNGAARATSSPFPAPRETTPFNPTAEIYRQDILDEDFATFIDMEAFRGNSPSPEHVGPPGFSVDNTFTGNAEMQNAATNKEVLLPMFMDQFEFELGEQPMDA